MCLTSWCTFWLHDALFDFITNFLSSWDIFNVLKTFWLNNVFLTCLTSWRTFDVMKIVLTSWRILWRHDVIWRHELFGVMTNFLTSWRTFDYFCCNDVGFFLRKNMMCFLHHDTFLWRHDVLRHHDILLTYFWRVIDVMTICLTCFWHHDTLFYVMTNVVASCVLDVMTNFLI